MEKAIYFNGKPLAALSLVELRELEAATIEAIIIDNDKRVMNNRFLAEFPENTACQFDKLVFENNIKKREKQLEIVKRQLNMKMSDTWV